MACFAAPAAVAVVTTVVRKAVQKNEAAALEHTDTATPQVNGKWTRRLGWLNTMLWGGTALLALEHIWHGELVPWPPFLTAVQSADQVGPMLREIAVYGGTMTAAILVIWTGMVLVAEFAPRWGRLTRLGRRTAERGA